ncbi:hypothetical protein B0H13DRAFT_2383690 [Mycena leptocephala]|nr:hypothetical protein B0H13DRAFT_2383690 [Mycena leptocephala]
MSMAIGRGLGRVLNQHQQQQQGPSRDKARARVRDPETFDGKDPEKLRTFLFQGILNFNDRPTAFMVRAFLAGKGMHKGFQGTVISDHDNAARVCRLAKKRRKGEDSWRDEDQDGIVVTIRSETGHSTVEVTVDKCLHRHTCLPLTKARFLPHDVLMGHVAPRQKSYLQGALPAPKTPPPARTPSPPPSNEPLWAAIPETPLAGEDNGEWMCVPGLNGKRFDVQVVGITSVKERVSNTLQKLEGRFGHILATAVIDLGAKKVEVCGVGKSGTKHAVHVQCIKPRRQNDSGWLITEVSERVVVIGPDMAGGTTMMGCYGLTQPEIPHYYEAGVISSSLCLAKNVALTYKTKYSLRPLSPRNI